MRVKQSILILIIFFFILIGFFAVLRYNNYSHIRPTEQTTYHRITIRTFSTLKLTHVDERGKAEMVNVIEKIPSKRKAIARATVEVGVKISELITQNLMKKGDVLSIAQIAGIMGAKNTSNLIPLTHNISLSSVKVDLELKGDCVEITSSVECFGKTGVEIEALMAVSIAALTIYG